MFIPGHVTMRQHVFIAGHTRINQTATGFIYKAYVGVCVYQAILESIRQPQGVYQAVLQLATVFINRKTDVFVTVVSWLRPTTC